MDFSFSLCRYPCVYSDGETTFIHRYIWRYSCGGCCIAVYKNKTLMLSLVALTARTGFIQMRVFQNQF